MRRIGFLRNLVFALLASPAAGWAQCALCRTAITQSPEGQRLAAGLNAGILFLFGAPFAIAGAITLFILKPRRPLAFLARLLPRRLFRRYPPPPEAAAQPQP